METVSGTVYLELTTYESNGCISKGVQLNSNGTEHFNRYASVLCIFCQDIYASSSFENEDSISEKLLLNSGISDIVSRINLSDAFDIELNSGIVHIVGYFMSFDFIYVELEYYKIFVRNFVECHNDKKIVEFPMKFFICDYNKRNDIDEFDESGNRIF